MDKIVKLFTDGACRGNPGPGGWGALLCYGKTRKELKGAEEETTNNRMELSATIEALSALKRPCRVVLTTDSRYVQDGITQWLQKWKKKGWLTSSKKPVKNRDLWERLDRLAQTHEVDWRWVKSHSGHEENEHVDRLANEAIDEMKK